MHDFRSEGGKKVHLHDAAVAVCDLDPAGADQDRGALFPAKAHIEAQEELIQ